jgi:hypothetical protein
VDELADSAHLVKNADGLRRRLADDGYLDTGNVVEVSRLPG